MSDDKPTNKSKFKDLITNITPLKREPTHRATNAKPSPLTQAQQKQQQKYTTHQPLQLSDPTSYKLTAESLIEHFNPGISFKTKKEFKRGKIKYDKIIDLHGMTVADAKEVFINDLCASYNSGNRVLLFIHGKAKRSGDWPILKNHLYHWALQVDFILGMCSAPTYDGGAGALIIYLKAKR